MADPNRFYLMLADSHIAEETQETCFFHLLGQIENLPTSVAFVFLGDIFELWIAVKNYESETHLRFLHWCAQQKAKGRDILFAEGNHEFFIRSSHGECFTDSGRRIFFRDGIAFHHGDTLNKRDIPYFLLRCGVRNHVTKFLLWLFGKTIGPKLSDKIRLRLKTTNMVNKKFFPENHVRRWGRHLESKGVRHAFLGHFHRQVDLDLNGTEIHVLPDWQNSHMLGFFNKETKKYRLLSPDDLESVIADLQQKG